MKNYQFPEELMNKKQWVNVISKISYTPHNKEPKLANLYDKEDWGTYKEVLDRVKDGTFEDIGFIFCRDNNILAIDVDSGTYENGILNDFGTEITNLLCSYTEMSVGHRGTHIFVKADIDINNMSTFSQTYKAELYNSGKMIQMTDNILIHSNIEYRQKEVEYLISKYFLEGLKHAEIVEERTDLIGKYYRTDLPPMTYNKIIDKMRVETLKSVCYKYLLENKPRHFVLGQMKRTNRLCEPKLKRKEIISIYQHVKSL